ncbi:MAG: penicillin acylase family protein [Acidobacteriota bacterium]|jgi:acyl-homoserine-lactone acylase
MTKTRRIYQVALLLAIVLISIALSSTSKTSESSSLAGKVTICRDTYGIPHILAETEEAAAFGFGYAQAEDHGTAIARELVSARGEEAMVFGTGIESDFLLKLYDNQRMSEQDLQRVGAVYRKMVNAYAEGLDAYFAQHRSQLPSWIPVVTGVDIMASRRAGAIRSTFSQAIIRALQQKYPSPNPKVAVSENFWVAASIDSDRVPTDDEEQPGSNALALSGTRTDSGSPILLGNPHLNWSSLYWEAQVTVPGIINFFGSTLAGIPVLRAGFNEHLGWVTTNNAPDVMDVFALPLDPAIPDHYLFNGKSRPLIKREISIEIKGRDGTPRTETRTFWESHLGKILCRTSDKAFAVASTQLDACHYYEGFYELSKTRSLKEFLRVMDRNMVPTSNFTYADAEGNIMYLWNARIAERPDDGTDYRLDVPAGTGKYVWKKMIEPSRFPRLLNPSGGYTQNCNNPPWYTSLRDPLDPKKYPSYLEEERGLALRPQVALEMLNGQEKFSLDDVIRLKFNTKMLLADRVKPALVEAIRELKAPSADLQRGLNTIEAWDNRVSTDSKGGVLFQRFWDTYSQASKQPFGTPWDPRNPAATPSGLSDDTLALKHFDDAVRWTRQKYGSDDVAWGEVHRFRFGSLDLPADGANGTYGLFRVVRFTEMPDGKQVAGQVQNDEPPLGFGDGWVIAVQFSKPVKAMSVVAYGQSTLSSSKHSSDQIDLFARHQLRPVWFSEAEIKANLEREYHPDGKR